jgi:hypothetical protein
MGLESQDVCVSSPYFKPLHRVPPVIVVVKKNTICVSSPLFIVVVIQVLMCDGGGNSVHTYIRTRSLKLVK